MKIWKIILAVLTIIVGILLFAESEDVSRVGQLANALGANVSALTLYAGYIVSILYIVISILLFVYINKKDKQGDIIIIILSLAAFVFSFAGPKRFEDLPFLSFCAVLCLITAIISYIINKRSKNGLAEIIKQCPQCGARIADDSRFCSECGKKIPEKSFCRSCGNRIEISDEYCPFCGSKQNDNIKSAHYNTNFATVEQSRLQSNVPEEQNCNYVITESQDVVSSSQTNQYDGSLIKWIIIGLILFLIIVGAGIFFVIQYNSSDRSNSEGNRGNIGEKVTLTSNKKTYNMRGAISKYPITMQIEINGSQINGYYYYNRQYDKIGTKAYLNVTGTYENGYIDMNETNSEGTPTGHFQGWLKNNFFKGNFINTNGEQMPFVLSSQ